MFSYRGLSSRFPVRKRRAARLLPWALLSLGLTANALPSTALAQTTLSFAQAQRIAIGRSNQLLARDASVKAAREMAVAAGQLPDPVVRAGIDNLPVDGSDRYSLARDFMTMRRIGVMQEMTRGEKRRLKAERFEQEAQRLQAQKDGSIAVIQRETAIAWLDRYFFEKLRAAVAAQRDEATREIEAAESAYRAGRVSQADVFMAKSSRAMIEDRLSELDRKIDNAKVVLARWIGEDRAGSPLAGEPSLDSVPLHAHKLEAQLERHPVIATLTKEIAVAETEAALAQANKKPDWSWEVAYQQRGPAFSNMVSFGVSIPLQWDQRNRQDRELAAKLAEVDKVRAERTEALREHVAEVRTMINEWQNGRERLRRYEAELIPLARDRGEAVMAAYRGGKADLASVLAARRNEIDVGFQALQLQLDTARIWTQLRFLYPDESLASANMNTINSESATSSYVRGTK